MASKYKIIIFWFGAAGT